MIPLFDDPIIILITINLLMRVWTYLQKRGKHMSFCARYINIYTVSWKVVIIVVYQINCI